MASDEPQPSTSQEIGDNIKPQKAKRPKRRLNTSEVRKMWNLVKLFKELGTRNQCIAFSEENGLIASKMCQKHKKPMSVKLSANSTVGVFVCHKGTCRNKSVSRANGTWFEKTKLELPQIFYLMYCFAHHWTYNQVILEDFTSEENCLSSATITDWYNRCREAVVRYQLETQEYKGKIGGPGKVVQIEESKFRKRKCHKEKQIDWVLGLIEDGSEDLRLEICPGNTRTAEVVVSLIKKHVLEGTTIQTDGWSAYDYLSENGYIHQKINNNNPEDPLATADEKIESQWRIVKKFFQKDYFNHLNFSDIIVEYLWRRSLKIYKKDPFLEIIECIKYIFNNPQ